MLILNIINKFDIYKQVYNSGKWKSISCTVGHKWVTVMDNIKFKLNYIILLYMKKDTE